jgi:chromate transporter
MTCRGSRGALAGVTAAVVGVIANLALWFGLRVIFARMEGILPDPWSLQPTALLLTVLAGLCLFRFKLGVVTVLGVTALAGLVLRLVGL